MKTIAPLNLVFIAFTLVTFFCRPANGEPQGLPKDLAASREEFLREKVSASIPVLERYLVTLKGLEQQYSREQRFDALPAIAEEIKEIQKELDMANATIKQSDSSNVDLVIKAAYYGDFGGSRTNDVTIALNTAVLAGEKSVTLNDALLGDPAPNVSKKIKITYVVGGKEKTKWFDQGHRLDLKEELK